MDTLVARIARRIRREGPVTVASYMAMALHDPADGYYARRDPLGRAGDFITAPEISQIFGELIGVCLGDWWRRSGRPQRTAIVEFGPGRGTLMEDLLRAAATVPEFRRTLDLYLVETSPVLRQVQQHRLAAARPHFIDSLDEVPEDAAVLLVANEFLDALPVRQLVRGRAEWGERIVALDRDDRLVFADGPENRLTSLLVPEALRNEPPGTIVEICPAAAALGTAIGERLRRQPGFALFIDYGCSPSAAGATLAGLRRHQSVPVLADPGAADLSAHVDFAAFAAAARAGGAQVHGPLPQGRFLTALGAETRLARLAKAATPGQRAESESGLARLIAPDRMGTLFKVLALTSPGLPAPAGFE